MKKLLAFILILVLMCSFAACKPNSQNSSETTSSLASESNGTTSAQGGNENDNDSVLEYTVDGNFLNIIVKAEELDYSAAPWVGICPVGEYASEVEADEADVAYSYLEENRQTVQIDISGVEKGDWLLVLCDSEDGDASGTGKVLATLPITIK